MEYKVILSTEAKGHFKRIIDYLLYELKNEQATISVTNDMEETIYRLSHIAGNLKLCDNPRLRALEYRLIHFKHHKYFMIYKINGNHVCVYGIYHDLQDYENILK